MNKLKSLLKKDEPNFETKTGYIVHKSNITISGMEDLRSKLSVLEFGSEEEIAKAFFEQDDYIFIPKIDLNVLNFINKKPLSFTEIEPLFSRTSKPFDLKWKALPHQVDVIKNGIKYLKEDGRLIISMSAGTGKTYVSSALAHAFQCKFLFVVYSGKIIDQAIDAMKEHLGSNVGLYKLSKSSDIEELAYEKIQGLYMTASMFKQVVKNIGIARLNEILFDKIGISAKFMDEFDRHVKNLYFMEAFMNFKLNVYITATPYKSLLPDDRIFQLVYRKVRSVGKEVDLKPNKDCIFVHYAYNPSNDEYSKIQRSEMTWKTFYNNYLGKKDILLDYIMEKFYHKKDGLFKRMLKEDGQIQIFVGRINNCDHVKQSLIDNHGIDEDDIGIMNSSMNARQKLEDIDKPFLISTSQSLGRGVDSDKVRVLVLMEFHFSLPELTQIKARIGRVGKKFGYLIFPVDHSFAKVQKSINAKIKKGFFKEGFAHNYDTTIPSEFALNYVNGYRKDSERAKEILDKKLKKVRSTAVSTELKLLRN